MSSSSGALRSAVMFAPAYVDDAAISPNGLDGVSYSLFFYGTLVHPKILCRMIQHDGTMLTVQPAILEAFALHHVKGEDYPALVPVDQSETLREDVAAAGNGNGSVTSAAKAAAVRGMLVHGLSRKDVDKLDAFEGDEYIRTTAKVLPEKAHAVPIVASDGNNGERVKDQSVHEILSSLTPDRIEQLLTSNRPRPQACHVYQWRAPTTMLEPAIWSFETFMTSGNHFKWWNDDVDKAQ